MSKSFIINLGLILIFFYLQVSFLSLLSPSYQIKILLLSGLSLLFIDRYNKSFWWFLLGGILLDLLSLGVFGLNVVIFMAIYLLVSYLKKTFLHQSNIFLIILIVAGSIIFNNLILWLTFNDREIIHLLNMLGWELILNLLMIWPIYIFFVYLTGWFDKLDSSNN